MSILHLGIRIDKTDDYYYPIRDSITPILRILNENVNYLIRKLIMCEETARKTGKVHCHIHVQCQVPPNSKVYKSFSQKLIRELEKQVEVASLPPRQFSVSSKPVKDSLRFMRYPLKDQPNLDAVIYMGYDENQIEIQRCLAFEERQSAIAQWDLKEKKKNEENSTFDELCIYLSYSCPVDISHLEYKFEKCILERLGSKIVTFYRVYKKSKLPFNLDKILFRYLLTKGIADDLEIFQMMSRT